MFLLEVCAALLLATRRGPSQLVKVLLLCVGPLALLIVCAAQLSSSFVIDPQTLQPYGLVQLASHPPAIVVVEGDDDAWADHEDTEERSFLEDVSLKELQKEYKRLKREYKKNHSKEDFLKLKYHAMNKKLKKAIQRAG